MGGQSALTGPDLAAGVALAELPEGQPFAGHARGEAVVLVRLGATVRAVGGHCTHYNAPLADGLVVGETLRCPWHHACFSLRSGEPLGAPALAPIACYDVQLDGDRVRVGDKQPRPEPLPPPVSPSSIVILGAGAAGTAATLELRRHGYRGPITLVGDEPPGPVDRPNLSKDYLAGTAPEEWIPLRTAADLAAMEVELIAQTARSLEPATQRVYLGDGRVLGYEALLIATGAAPIRPPIEGADRDHVFTLRTLADARGVIAAATAGRRAVVVGSSFIGLEVAASLRARGVEVDVVGLDAVPLARVLGAEVGRFVQELHEAHGVRFHLQDSVVRIGDASVTLQSGAELPADFVVLGVGVRPRTALAEAAGLRVEHGIVVDAELRASIPAIWAAGDVARYPAADGTTIRVEHWAAAQRQGQAAARSMLGLGAPFIDVPFFWSQHYDVTIAYVGHAAQVDHVTVSGDLARRDATITYSVDGKLAAVATIGRDRQSLGIEAALEQGDLHAVAVALGSPS